MPRAIFLFLTAPLFAQFAGLSTTNDGSQLYFSTSLQLNGSINENTYAKIFRYDASGLHFIAQMDKVSLTPGGNTNPYNLTSADVSGDGSVFGYVGTADCSSDCYDGGLNQTTLQYPGEVFPTTLPYSCLLSQNAKYAVCITSSFRWFNNWGVFSLFDSTQTPIYSTGCIQGMTFPRGVTSDGRIVCGDTLWSESGSTTLNLPGEAYLQRPLLSDDGSTVVTLSGSSLLFYDVATGAQFTIPFSYPQSIYPISISSDGSLALFTIAGQLAAVHSDGTGFLQLTHDPTGVSTAVLSGDGSIAYAVTASGKLLRIATATGASTQIASASQVQQLQGAAVAGSLTSITGTGLADATASASTFPLPISLAGAQVTVNGTPAPILSASPLSISFQMPWETPLGNAAIAVVRPPSQFTQPATKITIEPVQPFTPTFQVFSQDFSKIIGPDGPANPGDIVNFYLTGLGAVTIPVADGVLSPSNPLPEVTTPVAVISTVPGGTPTPLKVLYAGLAPGLVGIYQLTVQTPSIVRANQSVPVGTPVEVDVTLNGVPLPPVEIRTNQ